MANKLYEKLLNFKLIYLVNTYIKKEERQLYLKNAYRVLLTRARQGMVIVVPNGDTNDATRAPKFYDDTFEYLRRIGFPIL